MADNSSRRICDHFLGYLREQGSRRTLFLVGRLSCIFVPLACVSLSGCAHTPPLTAGAAQMCDIPRSYLELETHDDKTVEAAGGMQGFGSALLAAYRSPTNVTVRADEQPVSPSMLFLSGGSQHGAFGGGFVNEWARERPSGLPRFRVVTGISTGSIYATHAFLNRTQVIVDNERIFSEAELYKRYVGKGGMETLPGGVTTVSKGAVGDLEPMRQRYLRALTDEVMRAVAHEADAGRKLYIAVVDLDLGKATIFDMTALAQRYAKWPREDQTGLAHIRDCYSKVVLASSSVPVAVPPTFIDNRMYIDGGARFGLITDEVGESAEELGKWRSQEVALELAEPARPNIYLLINGTLDLEMQCGKMKKSATDNPCRPGTSVVSPEGQHEKWDILGVVKRSVDVLTTQIYRFSNDRIWIAAAPRGFVPHMQRMLPDLDDVQRTLPYFPKAGAARSCDDWAEEDNRVEHPIEFHARYMHCLVEYGADRARASKWACFDPLPRTVSPDARKEWEQRCAGVDQEFTDREEVRLRLH
jgi:hypothetical protein